MANRTSGPVWLLDTAGVVIAAGTHVRVFSVRWVGAASTTDGAALMDAAGREFWSACASVIRYETQDPKGGAFAKPVTVNGLRLNLTGTSKVYVQGENLG